MVNRVKINLNEISHDSAMGLVTKVLGMGVLLTEVTLSLVSSLVDEKKLKFLRIKLTREVQCLASGNFRLSYVMILLISFREERACGILNFIWYHFACSFGREKYKLKKEIKLQIIFNAFLLLIIDLHPT